MMTEAMNAFQVSKPSIWHRLGFHYQFDEALFDWRNMEPQEEGFVPGAFQTTTTVRVGLLDRIRLLVSGHCEITVYTKSNVMPNKMKSRSQFAVLGP